MAGRRCAAWAAIRHVELRRPCVTSRFVASLFVGGSVMLIIDAQVHAYERDHPGRPWAGVLTGPAEVTGNDMVAAMDAVGVAGAVLVSPFTMYHYDASY